MKIFENRWEFLLSYLILVYLIVIFLSNNFVITNELLIKLYSGILEKEQINKMLIAKSTFGWVIYTLNIILISLKIFSTAIVLYIGLVFNSDRKIKFTDLVKIVTVSEFIFILYALLKLACINFNAFSTLHELNSNYPLSLFSIIASDTLDAWIIYPLSVINIAEILYWFILAYFLYRLLEIKYIKSFSLVLNTYVLSLFLWMSIIVFLTISLS